RRHADELHVPGAVQAARDHPVEPAPREPRRIGANAVHGIDDVLGQRVRPIVLPRRRARREARLTLSTERAASGSARLRRDRDPLLPRPPRPRRAQVVEEEAVCRHEVLADRDWRAPVVELVRVSLPRLASAIYRTAGAETAGRRPRREHARVAWLQDPALLCARAHRATPSGEPAAGAGFAIPPRNAARSSVAPVQGPLAAGPTAHNPQKTSAARELLP